MKRIRVVLYAEGPGETGGIERQLPPPGEPLSEELLGPGHILLRRCLVESSEPSGREVVFVAPLKDRRGRTARGSMLLRRQTLRQLLTWLNPARCPDLAVVLVDQDEDTGRKRTLEEHVSAPPPISLMPVIGVAIQEFEAWLIADHSCVARILELDIQKPKNPEKMKRQKAKQILASWIGKSEVAMEGDEVRRQIVSRCNLMTVSKTCRAFEVFRKAVAAHV